MYSRSRTRLRAATDDSMEDGVDVDFEEEASSRNDGCLVGVVAAVAADVNVDRGTKAWQNDKLQNVATKKARATTRIESGTGTSTGNMLAGV